MSRIYLPHHPMILPVNTIFVGDFTHAFPHLSIEICAHPWTLPRSLRFSAAATAAFDLAITQMVVELPYILWMEEVLHQLIDGSSHYF